MKTSTARVFRCFGVSTCVPSLPAIVFRPLIWIFASMVISASASPLPPSDPPPIHPAQRVSSRAVALPGLAFLPIAKPVPPPVKKQLHAPELTGDLPREVEMLQMVRQFAPVIYHRVAGTIDEHRFDFPTNFDFDGDWVGNNNWKNAADSKFKLRSYVYYSVLESGRYYFLHYALYHPRDWSLVQKDYSDILTSIQQKYKDILTGGVRREIEFNHENDLEGVLEIVDKNAVGGPAVIAIETVAHDYMVRAVAPEATRLIITSGKARQELTLEKGHPVLYVESQKHGIHPWDGQVSLPDDPLIVFRVGEPVEYSAHTPATATYGLLPIYRTFWQHALQTREPNMTFGTVSDFADRFCALAGARRPACEMGSIGGHFRGDVMRPNSAAAPWDWIDKDDPRLPRGAWFFDPIYVLKLHFGQFDFQDTYLYNPYVGIVGAPATPPPPPPAVGH